MAKINAGVVAGGGVEVKQDLVAGAAINTNMALAGLSWKKDPKFIGVVRLEGSATYAAPVLIALTEVKKGTTDSTIQLSTTVTTGDLLLVTWIQRA
jgi:hypothetical protein